MECRFEALRTIQRRGNMNELSGKVAVVTGASKGIGAQIAKQLAAEGAAVVVNYVSSRAGADAVVAAILKDGGKAIAVQADVAKAADVKRLFAAAKDAFGRLDILVNNAGVFEFGKLDAVTKELANELAGRNIRVNVIAPGMTATEGLAAMGVDDGAAKSIGAGLPMGRIGRPDDIAQVATFLASDRAAWLTGERITVSGGQR